MDRIKARLPGTTTTILYGSTEAGRMAALQDRDLGGRPGSVGIPAFPAALWVGADVRSGQRGDLMKGYFGRRRRRRPRFDGTTYPSGDVGRLDDEATCTSSGAAGSSIRTGGEYVSPAGGGGGAARLPGVRTSPSSACPTPPGEKWSARSS